MYVPTDFVARSIARDWLREKLSAELLHGTTLTLTLGEMQDDGTCRVSLVQEPDVFSMRTFLDDIDTLDGVAWIEDTTPPSIGYRFGDDSVEPTRFRAAHFAVAAE